MADYNSSYTGTQIDNAVGKATKLPVVSSADEGKVLQVDSDGNIIAAASSGGMSNPMTTAGDIIVGGTSGAPTRLAKGSDGQVLTMASGAPTWASGGGGGTQLYKHYITATIHIDGIGTYNDNVIIHFYIINSTSTQYDINFIPLNQILMPIAVKEVNKTTGNFWGFIHRLEEDDGFDDLLIELCGLYGSNSNAPSTFKSILVARDSYFESVSDIVTAL